VTVRTKIEPISDWIKITVDETLSPVARSKAVAKFAHERTNEAKEQNRRILGRIPPMKHWVDGREGIPFDQVNPDRGTIAIEFELVEDVLRWIGAELVQRSPVSSGRYASAHTLFADGKEVPLGSQIPIAEEYSFTNLVPYARKIEIGKTKDGRAFVIQVQPRIYERTAKDARSKFGNVAQILFTFRGIVGLSSGSGTMVNPLKDPTRNSGPLTRNRKGQFVSRGGPKAYNRSEVRYPTITVSSRRT
jgi:hypothetical protein